MRKEKMADHKLQFHDIVKEEPVDDMNDDPTLRMDLTSEDPFIMKTDLSEVDLSSTVKIEEMNMNNLKKEAHLDEKASISDKQEDAVQLQSLASKVRRSKNMNCLHPRKLMKIAEDYANYSNETCHPTLYPKVLGFPIIQCPSCMIPINSKGHSAFLDLLLHVTRRHPTNCSFLLSKICERYMSLIGRMKRSIDSRNKTRYCLRVREQKRNVSVTEIRDSHLIS